jgi:hypothetical protein
MIKNFALIAGISALALQSVAHAGAANIQYVYVNAANGYASGGLAAASRGSGSQYITCASSGSLPSGSYVFCAARDASSNVTYCYDFNPPAGVRDVVAGINYNSYIQFYSSPSTGDCTFIFVNNGSQFR